MSLEGGQKPKPEENAPADGKQEKAHAFTRREFLGGLGVLAGGAAVGGTILAVDQHDTAQEEFEKQHTHEGSGVVSKKEIHQDPKPFPFGNGDPKYNAVFMNMPGATHYVIHIVVEGREGQIEVSKEEYEKFSENQAITVSFIDEGLDKDIKIKSYSQVK